LETVGYVPNVGLWKEQVLVTSILHLLYGFCTEDFVELICSNLLFVFNLSNWKQIINYYKLVIYQIVIINLSNIYVLAFLWNPPATPPATSHAILLPPLTPTPIYLINYAPLVIGHNITDDISAFNVNFNVVCSFIFTIATLIIHCKLLFFIVRNLVTDFCYALNKHPLVAYIEWSKLWGTSCLLN